ncbi:MAG: autotransporter assembly complex protein TamA [Zoogloea sp.]|uniref:autotransporter assembly complex protein TamA n=1 Tax=Zoogloea sp. TaxID=49181 RepID=UPI002621057E|nr:autotransporter assembly complex family protein [Zoogloea sp.]MDD2990552.1 autotransporter assembly complex protein TamA [Zoogloea sp.]
MLRHSSFIRLSFMLLALAGGVSAHGADSLVELQAPDALRPLLVKHLDFLERAPEDVLDAAGRVALMRRARKEIREILATEGYFSPAIERQDLEGERLRVVVTPGRRTSISALDLRFAGDITGSGGDRPQRLAALQAAWGLPVGQPFRQADWDGAKQRLLDALSSREYAAARISDSRALIDPETASARLEVEVDSGPVFRFGALQINGLSDYDASLIERYRPPELGEPYSQERLLRFQTALQNTSYFASVVVDIDRSSATPDAVPVRVDVTEAKPRRIGFGAGVSSNTGYRVETSYRDAHFMGQPWNLVSGVRVEQRRQLGYADVFLPPSASGYLDSVGALAEHTNISGLQTQRQSIGVVRTIPRGSMENRLALNYQQEILTPEGSLRSSRSALTANWSWTYRAVDNMLDPRHGQVVNLQLGGASRAFLSDRNFVRLYGRYQHFFPIGERDVLILRAEGGMTIAASRDGVPQDFLFRTGGAQTVRGYAYQSLGVTEGSAIVGGRYLAVTSAEYVHWYEGNWGVAAFVDAGNANDQRELFKMNLGYGFGPRWRSPAGPIAVDLAYGQSDHRVRLQFAVAIAF